MRLLEENSGQIQSVPAIDGEWRISSDDEQAEPSAFLTGAGAA